MLVLIFLVMLVILFMNEILVVSIVLVVYLVSLAECMFIFIMWLWLWLNGVYRWCISVIVLGLVVFIMMWFGCM